MCPGEGCRVSIKQRMYLLDDFDLLHTSVTIRRDPHNTFALGADSHGLRRIGWPRCLPTRKCDGGIVRMERWFSAIDLVNDRNGSRSEWRPFPGFRKRNNVAIGD